MKFWYLDLHFRSFNVGLECPSPRYFSSFISNNKLKWEKSKIVHFFYSLSSPLPVFPRASYGYIFTPPFSNYTPVYCHQCDDVEIFLNGNCFSSPDFCSKTFLGKGWGREGTQIAVMQVFRNFNSAVHSSCSSLPPTAIVCGLSACISSFLIRTLDVWTGMSGGSHGYALTCENSCLQMAEVDRYRLVLGPIIFWETVDNYSNQKEPVQSSAGGK